MTAGEVDKLYERLRNDPRVSSVGIDVWLENIEALASNAGIVIRSRYPEFLDFLRMLERQEMINNH